jgi:hypothetical protein
VELALLEISDPAVDEPGGAARSTTREIVALYESDLKPAHSGVTRHAAAGDPAADHQQVESIAGKCSHSPLISGTPRNQAKYKEFDRKIRISRIPAPGHRSVTSSATDRFIVRRTCNHIV